MSSEFVTIRARPELRKPRLLVGFSGWMDGGEVSTGAVGALVEELGALEIAEIDPEPFCIYSIPGSMETMALCRPHTKIDEGLITEFDLPRNVFYCAPEHDLILFRGKEPALRWRAFSEAVYAVVTAFDVRELYFVGSVGGLAPHTREPRFRCSVSAEGLRPRLESLGVRPVNYEGPASFVTLLATDALAREIPMTTLVAEIPAYIQGRNPICIEAAVRKAAEILAVPVSQGGRRKVSDAFERRVNAMVADRPELGALIGKLESDYDNEVFDEQMGDLKNWMEEKGLQMG